MRKKVIIDRHPEDGGMDQLTVHPCNNVRRGHGLMELLQKAFEGGYKSLNPQIETATSDTLTFKIAREMENEMHRVFIGRSYDLFNSMRSEARMQLKGI